MVCGGDGSYFALSTEGSWIDRIRARLPYSFKSVKRQASCPELEGKITRYALAGPMLREGAFSANYHNFWRRGHVFYMVGKLIDCPSMEQIWQHYRMQFGPFGLRHPRDLLGSTASAAIILYNSMQLEKAWRFVLDNHLDRERVMMTNLSQSLELCLKSMITHASFLQTNRFEFPSGHAISHLYNELPDPLREEITDESRVFADSYAAYRSQIENQVRALLGTEALHNAQVVRDERRRWESIAADLNDADYTAFMQSNDPGVNLHERRDVWFSDALDHTDDAHGFGDAMQYYRYAPSRDTDELPIEPITSTLLLARFFYEHLFPMPQDQQQPIKTWLLE